MHPIIFTDAETGGLDPLRHSLLTLACVVVDRGEITESHEWAVKLPEYTVSPGGMKVNGLNIVEVHARGLIPGDIATELRALSSRWLYRVPGQDESRPPLRPRFGGHNCHFDRDFIDAAIPGGSRAFFHHEDVDTKTIASFLTDRGEIEPGGMSLGTLYQRVLGRPLEGAHGALADATATAELYLALMSRQ